ncbi:MAG: hypothetical protein IJT24_07670 [Lachnospiraceae bacterium]|nr:hypothetical protein [Lachnospiraceae bacterium]
MKIKSSAAEGKINPNVVTVIVAALFVFALGFGTYYFNSPEARADNLISKAGTSIDEADYDNAITSLKGAYELVPDNTEANGIINSYLSLILDKAEESVLPEKKKWIAAFVQSFDSSDPVFKRTLERADKIYDEADKSIASAPYIVKAETLFDKEEYESAAKAYDEALEAGAKREDIEPKYDLNCAYLKIRELAAAPDRVGIIDYMNSPSFNCVKDQLGKRRIIDISNERYLVISKRKDKYLIMSGVLDQYRDGSAAGMIVCPDSNALYEGEWKSGAPDGYGKLIQWDRDKDVSEAYIITGTLDNGKFDGDVIYRDRDVEETVLSPEVKEKTEEETGKKEEEAEEEKTYVAGVPIFGDDANTRNLHNDAVKKQIEEEEAKKEAENSKKKKNKKKQEEEADEAVEEKPAVYPPLDLFDAQIWPVEDTPFQFKGSDLKAGTFAAGTPARIVAERDDEFYIRAGDKLGFVSRDACLINLPDVMQRELQYDITNSYSSKYKIDGRRIPGVTWEELYPYVKRGEGKYLVPLLYPAVKKLYEAEGYALKDGRTIRIYDAYQPEAVSGSVYKDADAFLKEHEDLKELMSEGGKKLKDFLPEGASAQSFGTALDMNLVDIKTGEELKAQSPVHEVSPVSIAENNTPDADTLKEFMEGFGFLGNDSRWWHFEMQGPSVEAGTFQVVPYSELSDR